MLWIGLLVGFIVFLLVMWRVARYVQDIEDDSTYMAEEQPYSPFGQRFLNILRGRK